MDCYKKLSARGRIDVARRGCRGQQALVVVDSLPEEYARIMKQTGVTTQDAYLDAYLRRSYAESGDARQWFLEFRQTNGKALKSEKVREYTVNASVLNAIRQVMQTAQTRQRGQGHLRLTWKDMGKVVEFYRGEVGHTLPGSLMRIRRKMADYEREGYAALLSGKYGNQSARKVNIRIERVILGIACLPNKPWNANVAEMYNEFVCGELDVYDPETGELFNPDEFTDKKGEPIVLSETTINNYLNAPKNQVLIAHKTQSWTTFYHSQAPHVHRHAPEFSFSKISFDDRDLPRKEAGTKIRPKAYYAYDVASQCVVGAAYSRNKTTDLVVEMFRNMFRLINRKGWGCPAEVEVENHLMSQWKDSFLKAGVMFPWVRFCAPQNSQEKYAEQMNGAKKRSVEHKNHLDIGRFYSKQRQYQTEGKKVFDEKNDTYEDNQYYTWEQLIAEDMLDIEEFNNRLHPNQKKYPGMTRLQVLEANMNPTLRPLDTATAARYVGERIETSIRRNSYCRVAHKDWWLSSPDKLSLLTPNDYKVTAYYLPNENGEPDDIYIYQGDTLIDRLEDVGTFNTARCEQTEEDKAIFEEQQKHIARFKRFVNENKIDSVAVAATASYKESESIEIGEADFMPEAPRDIKASAVADL